MILTTVELDLVGYSSLASVYEEGLGPRTVAELNQQIQEFVDEGLEAVGVERRDALVATTGDGAILTFPEPAQAHRFAFAVHQATLRHNSTRTEPSGMRYFRMGAATGDITLQVDADGTRKAAGMTIARGAH